jgi:predicted  nucleic acid-binding Zn-ribbon protein
MTDEELKQLIASNARAIEAAADERAELRQLITDERMELRHLITDAAEERAELRQAILKLPTFRQAFQRC